LVAEAEAAAEEEEEEEEETWEELQLRMLAVE
jgi:hypothetical protein